ncbi:MAG: glycosyltransferase family 2 protein [Succinivibrio sp.]|nr:glycosyltransferase family 2 protein [Succinivibrio sp.]
MEAFNNVSILLPTLNETESFGKTVDIILTENNPADLCEFIAIVCERTLPETLQAIKSCEERCAQAKVPLKLLYQTHPFAGGAVQDGMAAAAGSHTLMMAPDLETDPHSVKDFITAAKAHPQDMITASRWLSPGAFEGYSPLKYVLNFIFQKFFSLYYGTSLTDMTFGYRLAPASLFKSIAWEELRHPFFLETLVKPLRLGIIVHEIPTSWKAREEGESQNTLLQTFKYLPIAFKARFMTRDQILSRDKSHA